MGSSPRGRGKPGLSARTLRRVRLIPAGAGKTAASRRRRRTSGAHPRGGGENGPLRVVGGRVPGSSPRGRGKRGLGAGDTLTVGLIPAGAGKTQSGVLSRLMSMAHPRGGGENRQHVLCGCRLGGSSPRGRGKHGSELHHGKITRLIPAGAGKTHGYGCRLDACWAHPRGGGENTSQPRRPTPGTRAHPRGGGENQGRASLLD